MAAPISFFVTLSTDPQPLNHRHHHHHHHHQRLPFIPSPLTPKQPFLYLPNPPRFTSKSSNLSTVTTVEDSFKTGNFVTNQELNSLKTLQDFNFSKKLATGSMWVRVMRQEEMDITVKLLAESFAESMLLPIGYVSLLKFLVKQYLVERRQVLPHAVTLAAFYRDYDKEEEGEELAGTVEVCFNKMGANDSPPSPKPPKDSPYICNMTVKESLRRRGIGWNLLKASEELITQMSHVGEVYLHCRMIDSAPFNMYMKAGYIVVKTDSLLVLLMLQRRKHLMCKKLPIYEPSKPDVPHSDVGLSLQLDAEKS